MRKIQFAQKEFYHLYNRGVDKRIIFYDKEDHDRFRAYLYLLNDTEKMRVSNFFSKSQIETIFDNARGDQLVAIGAYCLMPNHFHILATPLVDNGISKFMQRLQTAYTMFFNEKRKREGVLFQGTFKAKHASTDDYLKYLFAYIHLNPAQLFSKDWEGSSKEEIENYFSKVEGYEYSSIGEYLSDRKIITEPETFPRYFNNKGEIKRHLQFWYKYKQDRSTANFEDQNM
jgi:putative transposase